MGTEGSKTTKVDEYLALASRFMEKAKTAKSPAEAKECLQHAERWRELADARKNGSGLPSQYSKLFIHYPPARWRANKVQ